MPHTATVAPSDATSGSPEPACSSEQNAPPPRGICADSLTQFESFLKSAMERLQVPGASIAVIHRGALVLSTAYGVKQSGRAERVDRATRFMIASATKPLTTLMMASLVGRRMLDWEESIAGRLPGFVLGDAETTARLSFRLSVSNSTGMPRHDMQSVFRGRHVSAEQAMAAMRSMQPKTGLGETYQYAGMLVAAGGYAAARAHCREGGLNVAYAQALSEHVFAPLGMTASSTARVDPLPENRATPHELGFDGRMVPVDLHAVDFAQAKLPAGGVWSTADDLAKYILLELRNGVSPDGRRLVAGEPLLARRAAGALIERGRAYGLGLFVTDSRGITVLDHGGNTFGFTAHVLFIPQTGSGLVLLTNAGSATDFRSAVCAKLFEMLLGREAVAEQMIDRAAARRAQELLTLRSEISMDAQDTGWMDEWVGHYRSPELGALAIRRAEEGYLVESESWALRIGSGRDRNGERTIVAVDPPLLGKQFIPRKRGEEPAILFNADQRANAFRRVRDA